MQKNSINDIRQEFFHLLESEQFVTDKTGVKTVEILNATFVANEPSIFGKVNEEWNSRELNWYLSKSLNVNDIQPPVPVIWKQVATPEGYINSNYGWCVFSAENGNQYSNVLTELRKNPYSRRAQMIYTRPSMHTDYNAGGMSDFMCCSNTTHAIRNDKLVSMVYFRSNDALFGYKGDFHWMNYIHHRLAADLNIEPGDIIWNASSLHIYERHFPLVV